MKRSFCLVVFLLAGTVAWAAGTPKIKFDRTLYDFGVTSLVESVTGTFTFQNTGDGELRLQKPKPSCGCTVAKLSHDTLKPGEKGELVFTISIGTGSQHLEKQIFVASNDPQNPGVALGIKVETKTLLHAEPPGISLGDVPLGATTNADIVLHRLDGKRLVITKVEPSSDLISARVEPTTNDTARLHVEVAAKSSPRYLSEQIRLFTDDSAGAAFAVFVSARLVGDIRLDPEALVWGMPDPDHWPEKDPDIILSRSFTVAATKPDRPLVVSNLTCTIKDMKVELTTTEKDREYEIEATLAHPIKESVRGTINFDTNLPSIPKVEVPVEVNVWKDQDFR